jgi:hypothetical protein
MSSLKPLKFTHLYSYTYMYKMSFYGYFWEIEELSCEMFDVQKSYHFAHSKSQYSAKLIWWINNTWFILLIIITQFHKLWNKKKNYLFYHVFTSIYLKRNSHVISRIVDNQKLRVCLQNLIKLFNFKMLVFKHKMKKKFFRYKLNKILSFKF